ncbi:hypothetical protein DW1_2092 [Proteiniborus sp. DW1]|uniref:hypothetical protein n=1 Tax=Proteiniborus sp. DW1 TaxID=1889883 RepID=UPI00092DEB08|nr:hypothetical protein [Proteiniborus sp. DW1]SCG83658.1 hypothetical protein DW1_2092 [Proteiniborus sp. DW1]
MNRARRFISVVIVLTILSQISTVFAAVSVIKTENPFPEPVKIDTDENGVLNQLSYISTSTGATSGIRYRFTEGKINIGGFEYKISFTDIIGGAKPPSGVTEYYAITITKDDILEGIEKQYGRKLNESEIKAFEEGLKNPDRISYSATIEIYNANTGKVLDVIDKFEDIDKIAGKHGFAKKHMDDMKTRFNEQPLEYEETRPTSSGVRPTFIRSKSKDD